MFKGLQRENPQVKSPKQIRASVISMVAEELQPETGAVYGTGISM